MTIGRILLLFTTLLCLSLTAGSDGDDAPINFHAVEEGVLYRCGQPNRSEMQFLQSRGIRTVLNLRFRINNKWEMKKTSLVRLRLKLKAQTISFEDMVTALRMIDQAEKPVVIHCLHGSDRTGCTVACYRMVFQGWSKEEAIAEFQREEFGYNYRWFPNLLDFLKNLDIAALKRSVEAP